MSNTISLPAFIESWRQDADRSRRDASHLARNCVFFPVELVCVRPDLQERAVHKHQLNTVLRKVQKHGLWPMMAARASEVSAKKSKL